MCSVNFCYQQDSNSLFKGSIELVTSLLNQVAYWEGHGLDSSFSKSLFLSGGGRV